ncbi:MAG: hypothetical protein J7K83_00970 [Candidatus Aenigmarchaeota archaeon]|nr:hypothetical protein [Candidatus Aenigmarchaeota archaeon]
MDDPLLTIARFAYSPNVRGYCGAYCSRGVESILKKEYISDEEKRIVVEWLKTFPGLMLYLSSIATDYKKDIFDESVIKAYIIGELKDNRKILDLIHERLHKLRYEKYVDLDKMKELPDDTPVTHNFHVLFLESKKHRDVKRMDSCKVSLGKVIGEKDNEILVEYSELYLSENKFKIRNSRKKVASPFFDVNVDEYVFIHWDTIFYFPNKKEREKYVRINEKLLEIINPLL